MMSITTPVTPTATPIVSICAPAFISVILGSTELVGFGISLVVVAEDSLLSCMEECVVALSNDAVERWVVISEFFARKVDDS